MFICYCSPFFCFSRFLRVMVLPPDRAPLFEIWGEALWRLRARWTLLDVVQSMSHPKSGCFSTCFIDSAIFYLFPIFSLVFRYLFIISSSVLEQAGFSEIEGVISSNPTWQCLYSVFFFASNLNSRACLKYTILSLLALTSV